MGVEPCQRDDQVLPVVGGEPVAQSVEAADGGRQVAGDDSDQSRVVVGGEAERLAAPLGGQRFGDPRQQWKADLSAVPVRV